MKHTIFTIALTAIATIVLTACGSTRAGAGGYDTAMGVQLRDPSYINYDLVPVGDRITYTIDISTRIALLEKGHIVKDLQNEAGSAEAELEQYFSVE